MAKFTKRAVLVGCNYPHTRFRLNGCTNDVKSIKAVIKERFGFLESNIRVLIDDDHIGASGSSPVLPTGANIKAALDEMAKKAEAGDVLFFYFSGHGTAIPVLKAGKPFRQDEAIVPCDLNLITDVDLRRFVSRLKKGASFTMLSDSCHSGGLIEKWRKQNVASWDRTTPENHDAEAKAKFKVKAKPKFLGFDFINKVIDSAADLGHNEVPKNGQGAHKIFGKDVSRKFYPQYMDVVWEKNILLEDDGILLSGCEAGETSYDIVSGDRAFGAFTYAVVTSLDHHRWSSVVVTNGELLAKSAKAIAKAGYGQSPCLYCSHKNRDEPFLGGFA
ncbi:hypothetical protein V6N13_033059 [Hibiscus sabdariffa]|uniref:Peptidase C14 caspase domain-containing protein n=1 Tax=Hibiscus sabdariffa TaxID=183260 RepID=A0ABR2FBL2_9ROSI